MLDTYVATFYRASSSDFKALRLFRPHFPDFLNNFNTMSPFLPSVFSKIPNDFDKFQLWHRLCSYPYVRKEKLKNKQLT